MVQMEDERVRMSYEVAVYREQLSLLRREMERISITSMDMTNALQSVEKLEKKNVLVPLGGGTFMKSAITDTKILVPIGAEFLTEMEKEEAGREIRRRIDATNQAVTRLNEEFEKINKKLKEVAIKLREAEQNVRLSNRVEEGIKEDYI